jgi:phosphatidate phosphatase APP1
MGYTTAWQIEKRVMLVRIENDLTTEVVEGLSRNLTPMLDVGIAPVHYISDVTHATNININAFKIPAALDFLKHPNMGWSVMVGGSQVLNVVANIVGSITGAKFKTAESVEEAIQILQNIDPTLRDSA